MSAFDKLEWEYVIGIMKSLGFSQHWCNLIYQCISIASFLIMINGRSHGSFKPTRGTRQGEPLSHDLLFLASEGPRMLKFVEIHGKVSGIKITKNVPSITHLMIVDDTLFFCKAEVNELRELCTILQNYELASGQLINKSKSSILLPCHKSNP